MPEKYEGPVYPILVFGNCYTAQIKHMTIGKNQDNVNCYNMHIQLSPQLIREYHKDRNENEFIFEDIQLPTDMVVHPSEDPTWNWYLCFLTYDQKEVPAWTNLKEIHLLKEVMRLKAIIERQTYNIDYLNEQVHMAKTDRNNSIQQDFTTLIPIIQSLLPAVSQLNPKENK